MPNRLSIGPPPGKLPALLLLLLCGGVILSPTWSVGAYAQEVPPAVSLQPTPLDLDAAASEGLVPGYHACPAYGPCACCGPCDCCCCCDEVWHWQLLPDGLIYRSYLAGIKEPRFGSVWFHEKEEGLLWDIALGGRVGMLRYGTSNGAYPEGWQLDIEGAAFPRLDPQDERDLVAADFRFGIPLTYGEGAYQTKFAYYHLSSHLGDEFMLKHPNVPRINYTRDSFVYGNSYYPTRNTRIYGEAEYSFNTDGGARPWAFQFGAEFTPPCPTGIRGAPFAAANGYLREDFNFAGTYTVEAGWQWRGGRTASLLRMGVHYLTGKSPQFEFFDENEQQIGGGIWYDY